MFLHGDFALISPASLLQIICQEQRSVAITAWRGSSQASMQVYEGLVVAARCDGCVDEEAVYRLMAWDFGQFRVARLAGSPAEATMAAAWEELVLEAARRRDELELALPALPPNPGRQQVESLLRACPSVGGVALVGYDSRLLASARLDPLFDELAPSLVAGLGLAGQALDALAGRDEHEHVPLQVTVYADEQPTLLLADWGSETRLLATIAPGCSIEDAIRELRLQVRMIVSSPL